MGPAPWYWNTYPEPVGASGRHYVWQYHGNEAEIEYLVTLNARQEPAAALLALNSYCRAFLVAPSRLGIWCPEIRYLRLLCFDPDQLQPFPLSEIAGWFKKSEERIYSATAPIAEFEISSTLAPGRHKLDVPPEFHTVDELLMVCSYPAANRDDAAFAVFALYPQSGLVEVLPQKWFTASRYNLGPQWITRVTRDPVSHRLIGDGFRIGSFELTADGTQLARWLE